MLSPIMLERSHILVNNLTRYMDANGFQQRQLANLAGISPTTLNNWLRSYSYPEPENLLKLAVALHCEVPDLTETESYQDERKRYLTIVQAALLNAYQTDREFQKVCDISLRLYREKRLSAYVSKLQEYVESYDSETSEKK